MELFYFPYQLQSKTPFNQWSKSKTRKGILLKGILSDKSTGFADLCPWEETDPSTEQQLKLYRQNKATQQFQISLKMISIDAQARQKKQNLLTKSHLIKNHLLIKGHQDKHLIKNNPHFEKFKIKMGINIEKENQILHDQVLKKEGEIQIRLDFNNFFQKEDNFFAWCKENQKILPLIEFIEDPYPFSETWEKAMKDFKIELAFDQQKQNTPPKWINIIILKPAIKEININKLSPKHQYVITHYLDHPIGQAHSLATAIRVKNQLKNQLLDCGLTPWETPPIESTLPLKGNQIFAKKDIGIGSTKYLQKLNWIKI